MRRQRGASLESYTSDLIYGNQCYRVLLQFFATFFEDGLGFMVQYLPVQLGVIIVTIALTSFMAWGFSILEVNFDPDWYLPQER